MWVRQGERRLETEHDATVSAQGQRDERCGRCNVSNRFLFDRITACSLLGRIPRSVMRQVTRLAG